MPWVPVPATRATLLIQVKCRIGAYSLGSSLLVTANRPLCIVRARSKRSPRVANATGRSPGAVNSRPTSRPFGVNVCSFQPGTFSVKASDLKDSLGSLKPGPKAAPGLVERTRSSAKRIRSTKSSFFSWPTIDSTSDAWLAGGQLCISRCIGSASSGGSGFGQRACGG